MGFYLELIEKNLFLNLSYLVLLVSNVLTGVIGGGFVLIGAKALIWLAEFLEIESDWFFTLINNVSGVGSIVVFLIFTIVSVTAMYEDSKKILKNMIVLQKSVKDPYDKSLNGELNQSISNHKEGEQ